MPLSYSHVYPEKKKNIESYTLQLWPKIPKYKLSVSKRKHLWNENHIQNHKNNWFLGLWLYHWMWGSSSDDWWGFSVFLEQTTEDILAGEQICRSYVYYGHPVPGNKTLFSYHQTLTSANPTYQWTCQWTLLISMIFHLKTTIDMSKWKIIWLLQWWFSSGKSENHRNQRALTSKCDKWQTWENQRWFNDDFPLENHHIHHENFVDLPRLQSSAELLWRAWKVGWVGSRRSLLQSSWEHPVFEIGISLPTWRSKVD